VLDVGRFCKAGEDARLPDSSAQWTDSSRCELEGYVTLLRRVQLSVDAIARETFRSKAARKGDFQIAPGI